MKRAPKAAKKRAYHHGDLKDELVAATDAILLERGVEGFTLREAARRAGVSPAAPAHHFRDAKGLLGEVVLRAFRDFGDALEAADRRGGRDVGARLRAQGLAYVRFALANPARFQLMFRHAKYDITYPGLREAGGRAFRILEKGVRDAFALKDEQRISDEAFGYLMAVWSIAHGFSHLALGGELDQVAAEHGGKGAILDRFLPLMLRHLPVPPGERPRGRGAQNFV
ncbi:MAG TPA: TetR/AcrR family transcriptional regulator [Rhizomicrobium sp.]|nr:TetR/AcrR family transcriptional regulator [Rhizomicrobium sp.]